MFRCKIMDADDWANFETKAINVVMGNVDLDHALFREAGSLADPGRILIAGPNPGLLESLSPGDWSDLPDAQDRKWIFLLGDNASAEKFGLTLGL